MEMMCIMDYLWFLLPVAILTAAVLITAYICFRMAFFVKPEDKIPTEEYPTLMAVSTNPSGSRWLPGSKKSVPSPTRT